MSKTSRARALSKLARWIESLGGDTALAAWLGVSRQAVSAWRRGARPIPPARAIQFERMTEGRIRARDLA